MGIGDFLQKNPRSRSLLPEVIDVRGNGTLYDVVSKNDADGFLLREEFGEGQCRGNSPFPLLVSVIDVVQSKLLAVAEQPEEISCVLPAGYNQYVANARIHHPFDGIVDHRLVVYRQ